MKALSPLVRSKRWIRSKILGKAINLLNIDDMKDHKKLILALFLC